jgi:hypothetical protein
LALEKLDKRPASASQEVTGLNLTHGKTVDDFQFQEMTEVKNRLVRVRRRMNGC